MVVGINLDLEKNPIDSNLIFRFWLDKILKNLFLKMERNGGSPVLSVCKAVWKEEVIDNKTKRIKYAICHLCGESIKAEQSPSTDEREGI